jgi:hypothetical protein
LPITCICAVAVSTCRLRCAIMVSSSFQLVRHQFQQPASTAASATSRRPAGLAIGAAHAHGHLALSRTL